MQELFLKKLKKVLSPFFYGATSGIRTHDLTLTKGTQLPGCAMAAGTCCER